MDNGQLIKDNDTRVTPPSRLVAQAGWAFGKPNKRDKNDDTTS